MPGNAFVDPTQEELKTVMDSMFWIEKMPKVPDDITNAVREIRLEIDNKIRGAVGITRHYRGIRALSEPQTIDEQYGSGVLVGEEFFGINWFLPTVPDLADVVWLAVYDRGSWSLETRNSDGEHLSSSNDGQLRGFAIKVNGVLLQPSEVVSFYRTLQRRDDMNILSKYGMSLEDMRGHARDLFNGRELNSESSTVLTKFGMMNSLGKLTYVGSSFVLPQAAIPRKTVMENLKYGREGSRGNRRFPVPFDVFIEPRNLPTNPSDYFGIDFSNGRYERFLKCANPFRFEGVGYAYC
jgi:hypothetical protein